MIKNWIQFDMMNLTVWRILMSRHVANDFAKLDCEHCDSIDMNSIMFRSSCSIDQIPCKKKKRVTWLQSNGNFCKLSALDVVSGKSWRAGHPREFSDVVATAFVEAEGNYIARQNRDHEARFLHGKDPGSKRREGKKYGALFIHLNGHSSIDMTR